MKKRQIKNKVRQILGKYLDGSENEFISCTIEISDIINAEIKAKDHFRKQSIDTIIELNAYIVERSCLTCHHNKYVEPGKFNCLDCDINLSNWMQLKKNKP